MTERTTVRLPPDLMARAKRKAAAEGRTLTSLIEDGLRAVVAESGKPEKRSNLRITGLRGVGKTVLLDAFEGIAIERGWFASSTEITSETGAWFMTISRGSGCAPGRRCDRRHGCADLAARDRHSRPATPCGQT